MSKRRAISKRTRFEVFKRDGFTCVYCGGHPPEAVLEVDHLIPVAADGDNGPDNLVTACDGCNRGKAAVLLSTVPESLSVKAARIAESEAQLAGFTEVVRAKRERLEAETWLVVAELTDDDSFRRDHLQSIKSFVDRLGVEGVIEAAQIARAKVWLTDARRFRYFCGVCWQKIRDASEGNA